MKFSSAGKFVFVVMLAVCVTCVLEALLLREQRSKIEELESQLAEEREINTLLITNEQAFRIIYGTPAQDMGAGIIISGFAIVDQIDERNTELTITLPLPPPPLPRNVEGF